MNSSRGLISGTFSDCHVLRVRTRGRRRSGGRSQTPEASTTSWPRSTGRRARPRCGRRKSTDVRMASGWSCTNTGAHTTCLPDPTRTATASNRPRWTGTTCRVRTYQTGSTEAFAFGAELRSERHRQQPVRLLRRGAQRTRGGVASTVTAGCPAGCFDGSCRRSDHQGHCCRGRSPLLWSRRRMPVGRNLSRWLRPKGINRLITDGVGVSGLSVAG